MAFGISGSNTSTNMVGADVVVTWINNDGPSAVDYYLSGRQQVASHWGSELVYDYVMLCCDTVQGWGGGVSRYNDH